MPWDARRILATLPHRYPFLLVDRIVEVTDSGAVGLKHVSFNEWFFQGHFPGHPIMPGVLIIEALAQVGAVALLSRPEHEGKIPFFAGIDGARFRRPVGPGDTLRLEVELTHLRGNVGKGNGRALVDGQLAAEAVLLFALSQPEAAH